MNSKFILLLKPAIVFTITVAVTGFFVVLPRPRVPVYGRPDAMARSFIMWLHGLGDSGPANEHIKNLFNAPEFKTTKWSFPSAPNTPVTCNSKSPYHRVYAVFVYMPQPFALRVEVCFVRIIVEWVVCGM
nr:probable carboxylesterase SOBER1-like [Ipomoea batatas]GMD06970.1 probable carboxylesterase SOBER1-like [Ipomoea batatas]